MNVVLDSKRREASSGSAGLRFAGKFFRFMLLELSFEFGEHYFILLLFCIKVLTTFSEAERGSLFPMRSPLALVTS